MTGQARANYSETKLAQTDPCMWTRICTDTQAQVPVPPHGGLGYTAVVETSFNFNMIIILEDVKNTDYS